jgi:selenocysteine lyase/cysteine desulfurase
MVNKAIDIIVMEKYFSKYRQGIIGINHKICTPVHESIKIIYTDWTASGRLYLPIEKRMQEEIFPFVANTHTETNYTGHKMTFAYQKAQEVIKAHVGANKNDVLISSDSGMTGVINKFQRILGLKIHESLKKSCQKKEKPIVFITHMEHHSNQTSWIETIADVVIVPPDNEGLVSINNFREVIKKYENRSFKIASITSCSHVTGIATPYMDIAELIHAHGGVCFVDFACSAPYVKMDMHPCKNGNRYLDAIFFSTHKFMGGPGTTGILVFNRKLYSNSIPDNPGGGTVDWTDPWGKHKYVENIEAREDGGTPAFLQTIKAAMCMRLKDEMGVENIQKREEEILNIIWAELDIIPNLHVLANNQKKRLGIISFYIDGLHYNLGVKMLNDYYGIQTRGGCSCAGTYGHYLMNIKQEYSKIISDKISEGDCSIKPGWIRLSIHPTHTNDEIKYLLKSIKELAENHKNWKEEYEIDISIGNIKHKKTESLIKLENKITECFTKKFSN